ncbi:uncharacterized protein LOC126315417 [Schistocerca gregaria]|uniref:uncharacterized protein LOC126315417 n=1 Tax=Schistocerca gregaria TaxID=7010 RepID=UPI00211E7CFC|nr:uncharacterized protein LOC126315417 [Schistocerca gregaria]
MQTAVLTSASNFLSLLDENESDVIKDYALKQIDQIVDQFWPEISDSISVIEELHERADFVSRKLAALVASKVFYYLGAFSDAMFYALRAEELFDITAENEFVETLVVKCIDEYIRLRTLQSKEGQEGESIDPRLENIVNRMFDRCFRHKKYRHAIGIALQSRRTDCLEQAIRMSPEMADLLRYTFYVTIDLVPIDYRPTVLSLLARLYAELQSEDAMSLSRCLTFLEEAEEICRVFARLLERREVGSRLLAYQIAFEVVENASSQLLREITRRWRGGYRPEVEGGSYEDWKKVGSILTNEVTIELYLQFLYRNNRADLNILKHIKSYFEPRSSILYTATIVANALMHAGTTRDTFLRDNLEWVRKATNWTKFTMAAGLGVIHKGHLKEALNVLEPYLPRPGATASSPYTEGGSLYALGLIHANHGNPSEEFNESFMSSCATVGGLQEGWWRESEASMGGGSGRGGVERVGVPGGAEELFRILCASDDAVAGEAVGYALGLVMLGSAHQCVVDLLVLAHETQHDKVVRGLVIGLAFLYYGREGQADAMIEQLLGDKEAILRYGGAFMIGMAYGGTGRNSAIQKLLHIAVSDVNDDVRRAAVMNLGFVLFRQPERVPQLVALLAESYNPAVRYGACLALGMACAGTGLREAYDILLPLAHRDPVDTVRQGALISLAMLLIQSTGPCVNKFRKHLRERIEDKHESAMAKYGAILASGILDAGGRNVTISLLIRSGYNNLQAMVGLAMFLQYWYWYPLVHFISLALAPTAIIALNQDLQMIKMSFRSHAPVHWFSYPAETRAETKNRGPRLAKLELAAARRGKKKRKWPLGSAPANQAPEPMCVDAEDKPHPPESAEKPAEKPAADDETSEPHKSSSLDSASSKSQFKYITFDSDERYKPICEGTYGIVVMQDLAPHMPLDLVSSLGLPTEQEPSPPEPFEFNEDD